MTSPSDCCNAGSPCRPATRSALSHVPAVSAAVARVPVSRTGDPEPAPLRRSTFSTGRTAESVDVAFVECRTLFGHGCSQLFDAEGAGFSRISVRPSGATGTGRAFGPALFEDARRVLRHIQRRSVTGTPTPTPLAPWQFDMYVDAEIDGDATPEQLAVLEADPVAWRASLLALLRDAEEHLASARSLRGEEREQVIADLESEHRRLADGLGAPHRATSRRAGRPARARGSRRSLVTRRPRRRDQRARRSNPASSRSRSRGSRVASSRGPRAGTRRRLPRDELADDAGRRRARRSSGWTRHGVGAAAGRRAAPTRRRSRSVTCWAGWSRRARGRSRVSARACGGWAGVAIWAVELTARGAMVPFLRQRTRRGGSAARLERFVLGALDAGPRRSRPASPG